MKILWLCSGGIGNVIESIPAYLCVEKWIKDQHEGIIDVKYMKEYETDSKDRALLFPVDYDMDEVNPFDVVDIAASYDYIVKPPYIHGLKGWEELATDDMRERDSEVQRDLRVCDFFGCEKKMLRRLKSLPTSVISPADKFIVLHNGALQGWEDKKYLHFERLIKIITKEYPEYVIGSIGSKDEYIEGTQNWTGVKLNDSLTYIALADLYIGTDTGTMHIAGFVETPGIAIFTWTDPGKNWDKDFHHTITPIYRKDLDCIPCQKGYHISVERRECKVPLCRDLHEDYIMELVKEKLNEGN